MENRQALAPLQILWDYLGMHQKPEQADCMSILPTPHWELTPSVPTDSP